jgi:hypothetical protein
MQNSTEALERLSLDELRALAKKLKVSGYSGRRKADLIARIQSSDEGTLQKHLFPTWWQIHHNHVYGVIGVVGALLAIPPLVWSLLNTPEVGSADHSRVSTRTIEKPIAFADYAALPPAGKKSLFQNRNGEEFVWEGYLMKTRGFELGTLTGVPYDTPVSIEIKPTNSSSPQLSAEGQFGELQPTDSGAELAIRLNWLVLGQRIRLAGMLGGTPERPVLKDAVLEAVFPVGE